MFITKNLLYRDTFYFIKKKINIIMLLALLCSFTLVIINYIFIPDMSIFSNLLSQDNKYTHSLFSTIQNMNQKQKKILLVISAIKTIGIILSNCILASGIALLIKTAHSDKRSNILDNIYYIISIFPKLFFLFFINTLCIQIGFICFILPGLILYFLLMLSPIILIEKNDSIVSSIYNSIYISYKNIQILLPLITIWTISKLCLLLLTYITINIFPIYVLHIVSNSINYFILSVSMIYLFRFFMLLN